MTKKRKRFFLNILVLVFAIITALIFAEFLLRIFSPQNLNLTKLHPEKMYELKPGIESILKREEFLTHVKVNSRGLRDREYQLAKPKTAKRIAVVGDSFVFGYGVELNETMVKLLESKLSSKTNRNYEVINFGVSAYGTEQEYILIKNEVIRYSPDIIVLAFAPNDLKENVKFNLFDAANATLIKNHPQKITPILNLRNYISWHSHLYSLIYLSVIDNQKLRDLLIKSKLLNSPYKDPNTDFDTLIYLNSKNRDFDYSVNKSLLLIREINNIAKQNNITLIVFIVPYKEQVDDSKMKDYIKSKNLNIEKINTTKVQEIIKNSLQKDDVLIIDPLDQFKKFNINNTFYYNTDGHWNKRGHQFSSGIIYENLIKLKIVS